MSDVFVELSIYLIPAFAKTQSSVADSLEGQVLQGGLFKGFKETLKLVKYQRNVPRGDVSVTLRSVSMETIQETSEIFILADIDG